MDALYLLLQCLVDQSLLLDQRETLELVTGNHNLVERPTAACRTSRLEKPSNTAAYADNTPETSSTCSSEGLNFSVSFS